MADLCKVSGIRLGSKHEVAISRYVVGRKTSRMLKYSRKADGCIFNMASQKSVSSVLDERFASGTIGFFSSAMQDGVYFDKLRVEALPCETLQQTPPPLPPQCSVFADTYFSSVSALYTIIDGEDKGGAIGYWEYRVCLFYHCNNTMLTSEYASTG